VPLYSLCCGSRVVLSDDQRPNPLNTGCSGAAPDSTDPLAQFPSEPPDAPNETDRAPRSAEDDHLLLAFASETAVTDACAVTDASAVTGASSVAGATGYRPLSALWRVVPTTVMLAWSCIRVVTRPFLLGFRGAPRASRDAVDRLRAHFVPGLARLVVRATAWAFAFCRRLRMREEPDQQFGPLTGGRARARRFRRIAATHGAARQGRHAVPSHRWTYPTSLFLSGAAAGAFLVMVVRVPAEDRVAAQVSAQPTTQVVPANYIVGERPATPAPTVAPLAQSEQPVSTSARAQQSLRPGPVAVSARTVRTRPQSFLGSMSINSRPEGAVVFLNGRRVGTTPLLMPELPVGSRAVRLTMSGYNTWSQAVQVVADRRTTVSATLIEAPDTTVSATLLEASQQ
jgi:PEGA domain-containing protein